MKNSSLFVLSAAAALMLALSFGSLADAQQESAPAVSDANVEPAGFNARPPTGAPAGSREARQQAYREGIEEVRRSGILDRALTVGDKAIDFELPTANGTNVRLSELLAVGPVVVTFYRGNWCPYCNRQLQGLQEVLNELQGAGAQLVAVSPELPEKGLATQEKNHLAFPLLSDKGNVVARQYGIVFRVSDKVMPYYRRFFNMEEYNGDRSYELPLAATYVISGDGVIRYAFLDADYKRRADPQEALSTLRQLGGSGASGRNQ